MSRSKIAIINKLSHRRLALRLDTHLGTRINLVSEALQYLLISPHVQYQHLAVSIPCSDVWQRKRKGALLSSPFYHAQFRTAVCVNLNGQMLNILGNLAYILNYRTWRMHLWHLQLALTETQNFETTLVLKSENVSLHLYFKSHCSNFTDFRRNNCIFT